MDGVESGSWEKLQNLDMSSVDDTDRVDIAPGISMSMRDFVEECYLEPGRGYASRSANEGW